MWLIFNRVNFRLKGGRLSVSNIVNQFNNSGQYIKYLKLNTAPHHQNNLHDAKNSTRMQAGGMVDCV